MAYRYPRRVKDLPSFDIDFEDEVNVAKETKTTNQHSKNNEQLSAHNNKENDDTANQSNNNSYRFNNLLRSRIFPKRSCELPTLESESDEEDNDKKDHLNCAILNESFIMSPSKSDLSDTAGLKTCDDANVSDNLSFLLRFDKMALSNSKAKPMLQNTPANKKANELIKLTSNQKPVTAVIATSSNITSNTSTLANETQFATPQVRTFSVHRRQGVLTSAQTQKKRSDMLNEFRSQKVLFQTPMALSRAPLACLPNDSLALSLCDTLLDSISTPNTSENLADAVKEKSLVKDVSTKKSLEAAFSASAVQPPCPTPKQPAQNVLLINNVAYCVQQMLGSGGSSSVYSALRITDDKQCALKVVDLMGDPAVIEGYLNETKLLAKLQGNPCVVTLYD